MSTASLRRNDNRDPKLFSYKGKPPRPRFWAPQPERGLISLQPRYGEGQQRTTKGCRNNGRDTYVLSFHND